MTMCSATSLVRLHMMRAVTLQSRACLALAPPVSGCGRNAGHSRSMVSRRARVSQSRKTFRP